MPPYPHGMPGQMPPPPPRRKPGEKDENEAPRKGRCLLRENAAYAEKKSSNKSQPPKAEKRDFGQVKAVRSGDYHLLNGIRVGKSFFWATASALGLIVLAVMSIPIILFMQSDSPKTVAQLGEATAEDAEANTGEGTPAEPALTAAPLRDRVSALKSAALERIDKQPSNMEEVMLSFSAATGLDSARTISMEGKVTSNNREYEINLFVKAPLQIRQVLSQENLKVTSVFNGNEGRLELENYSRNRQDSRNLTPNQSISLVMSSVLALPLWQNEANSNILLDAGNETIDGEVYRVITNRAFPGCEIKHYLDMDRMIERKRVAKLGGDDPMEILVRFLDYKMSGDYNMPMRIEILENRAIEIRSIIEVDKWSFNQGLLPSLFVVENN